MPKQLPKLPMGEVQLGKLLGSELALLSFLASLDTLSIR
jgi:hypothetical protein